MPPSAFTELTATTFRQHRKKIVDNVSERNAYLKYVKRNGNYKTTSGGTTITIPLDYAQNATYQRYSDWDLLNISQSEVLTAAEYQWRQIAIHVVASGRDERINSGDEKIIDLVAARLKNAIRTFSNNFSIDLYSAGSLTNQINGLAAMVAEAPTNTVGGISGNDWTFWKNEVLDASDTVTTPSASNIENGLLLPLWLSLDRGPDDQPDLIVMNNTYYQYFEGSQVSLKRYESKSSADAGFVTLKYKNADVLYDGNSGILSNVYMLNTRYLGVTAHKDADMEEMSSKVPTNQDGSVVPILWMGNAWCSNRSLQGVIKT